MSRYWRIYRTFFLSSFARELEFRANFFAKVAQNCVWVFFFIMILLVIYRNTNSVAGWSKGDAMILAASCFLMNAMIGAFFLSLQEIPQQVRQGTLDFVITKPVDTQFWISTRKFNFDQLGTLLAGVGMVIYGTLLSHLHPNALQWGEHDYGRAHDDAEKARYAVHRDACDLRSITGRGGEAPSGPPRSLRSSPPC